MWLKVFAASCEALDMLTGACFQRLATSFQLAQRCGANGDASVQATGDLRSQAAVARTPGAPSGWRSKLEVAQGTIYEAGALAYGT